MSLYHLRPLLLKLTLPTVAVLLSYLWYKRKRIGARSDPGDTNTPEAKEPADIGSKSRNEKSEFANKAVPELSTPTKSISRSLSGVESTPIDIVFPVELRANKSASVVISDEDLDLEIEKIKSMRNGPLYGPKMENSSPVRSKSKTPSSVKENKPVKKKKNLKKENSAQAQKEIEIVDEKLTALTIADNSDSPKETASQNLYDQVVEGHAESQRKNSERDSANHSPSDVMLASASMSSISDNQSEGSSDSGKGGSDSTTPTQCSASGVDVSGDVFIQHIFEINEKLVGKLIGKKGNFVLSIHSKTNALVFVTQHPTNDNLKICVVQGTQIEVDSALKMVRNKFPAKRFPALTLEPVMFIPGPPIVELNYDELSLKLVEGIPNDNVLSCLVTPGHLFLQHPIHPSFPNLQVLTSCMDICYSQPESPLLPNPIPETTVCAAYSLGSWYRAIVLSTDVDSDKCYIKYVDCGGFAYVPKSDLRLMRCDFMQLPFQASECFLANIRSVNEDGTWPQGAYHLVANAARSSMFSTYVIGYTCDGIPLVYIHVLVGSRPTLLNQLLVDYGFAEWIPFIEDAEPVSDDFEEGAVGGLQE